MSREEGGSRNRKAEQSEQTRNALLDVAGTLFASKGYASTSIEEMVRQAGMTKGALYHHFRDKPALFEAVVARHLLALSKRAQRLSRERVLSEGLERRGWERLAAALRAFLDQLCRAETRRLVLVDGPAVLGRDTWDRLWVESSLVGVRRVLEGVSESAGVAARRIEPLARVLLGGLQEAAQAIAHADDPVATRAAFEDALLWALWALHQQADDERRSPERAMPPLR